MPHVLTRDLDAIDRIGFTPVRDMSGYAPEPSQGISKYRLPLGEGVTLDSLVVNQESDTLIVSCHGALQRDVVRLPRFERLRTFLGTSYSSLYLGDPTLHLSERLALAWYTGWKDLDLYPVLADWVTITAEAIGATKVIFVGSSGGGFASLQISTLVPGSLAVPLNPQTAIWRYRPKGTFGHQRSYIRHVMPHLTPEAGVESISENTDWSAPLAHRASAVARYAKPQPNYVYYAQNLNDISHFNDHYAPFREAVSSGPNADRVRYFTYDGQHSHASPRWVVLSQILKEGEQWLSSLENTGQPSAETQEPVRHSGV